MDRRFHYCILLLFGVFQCSVHSLLAQKSKIIDLRSADILKGKIINGEDVRELIGNVHFVQPTETGGLVKVWCNHALRYMTQNKIELFDHVKVIRDSATMYTNEGVYYGERRYLVSHSGVRLERGNSVLTAKTGEYFVDEKRSHFIDNVVLIDSTSTITCQELNYYEDAAKSVALRAVHVIERANGTNIYGDSLVHFDSTRTTIVTQHPRLVKIDTTANGIIDTTVIRCSTMHSYQDSLERFIAIDSVQMVRADMASRSGFATFFVKLDSLILMQDPIIWSGENQITGDTIFVKLEEKKIRRLYDHGHAMAISRADTARHSRFNQLTGRNLIMYFSDNKLQQVDVQQNATSLYYLYDDKAPNGVNKSSGDRILIEFTNEEVNRIKIVGGVEGQYFPEKMINMHETNYNLDGFHWLENRPERIGIYIVSN